MPLIGVVSHYARWSTAAEVFHILSLGWLHAIPDFPLMLSGMVLHHPSCHPATQWGCSVQSKMSPYSSQGWLYVDLGALHQLNVVTVHCFRCSPFPLGGSVSSLVFHCHVLGSLHVIIVSHCPLLVWFCDAPGVTLVLIWVAPCLPRCLTVSH